MEPIAIIGIGCRFPGADGPEAYWRLLASGVDAIREVPPDRFRLDELYDPDPAAPGKLNTRHGGFLGGVDRFDAGFFGISPREAVHVDPQQRLLLEVAWEAMEDGGVVPERIAGQAVGVFLGVSSYDYGAEQLARYESIADGYVNTGSALSIAANRISYLFDLRGPSLVIDTACSSSLVAAYLACQSLSRGESTLALAGGVNLILSPSITIGFSKLQAMAKDGRCKAFDARADGYVRGEGAGIVVLKPLAQALADSDRIYAVIRGGALNQDGRTNGLTAPNGLSQEALLREAMASARVAPCDIDYVEAHGTGTALGDPIELNALGAALAPARPREKRCAVGSVKTNFGHLEAAAGVAGLIKLALSLERRQIAPNLHFEKPNPYIRFDALPLRVPTSLEPWPSEGRAGLGGVSSFGFGGTNAHLVLEEPPRPPAMEGSLERRTEQSCLLPISARSQEALLALVRAYALHLRGAAAGSPFSDLCATAATRRSHHDFRLAAVGRDPEAVAEKLEGFLAGESPAGVASGRRLPSRRRKVAFVFPGQGSQWLGMGRELLESEPVFARSIEASSKAIADETGWSLLEELRATSDESRLEDVDVVQPALFAVGVALAELWRSWGIKPDAVVGQSMGEVAAAHVAGALSLEDAVAIICRRSRLAKKTSGEGAMGVVELSFESTERAIAGLEDRLSVAVASSPTSTVLSGHPDALEEVLLRLERDGVFCKRVKVDYASHSPQMDPLREELLSTLESIRPRPAKVPLYSTVTADVAAGPDLDASYWVRNLRDPVLFANAVSRLLEDGIDVFLEVSPHPILLPAIQQCLHALGREGLALGSTRRNELEKESMLAGLAALYSIGRPVDFRKLYPRSVQPERLPTYAWQRERFWFDGGKASSGQVSVNAKNPLVGQHLAPASGPAEHFWEMTLSTEKLPFLKDHQVQGNVVVPATAFLEMAMEAAGEALREENSFSVEEARFEKFLALSEEGRSVQVAIHRGGPGLYDWEVASRGQEDETLPWTRHARGAIRVAARDAASENFGDSIESIQARCPFERSGADHYRKLSAMGLQYGPAFQRIERIRVGTDEALARLKPAPDSSRYRIHPAILDAALTLLAAALPEELRATFVPTAVASFEIFPGLSRSSGTSSWAHATSSRDEAGAVVGDVTLISEEGVLQARARGIRLEPLSRPTASVDDSLYAIEWEKRELDERTRDSARSSWLVLSDAMGIGARVSRWLSDRGARVVELRSGESIERVLSEGFRPNAVVHLWGLDIAEPCAPEEARTRGWESALFLSQALLRSPEDSARLWLVTRSAQKVSERDVVSPANALLWGFARAIEREHPELGATAIDLSAEPGPAEIDALLRELLVSADETQVALREKERFVARLSRVHLEARKAEAIGRFRAEAGAPGEIASVTFREAPRRRPAPDEVEIEVLAAGLNFRDALLALGVLPGEPGGEIPLGFECSGRIAAVGDRVRDFAVGDEVFGLARSSLSSFVRTHAALVARKPDGLDFETAAALPVALLTAHYSLTHLARLRRSERVLVHSATGGVGLACVRLAQAVGAEVYATAGTTEKRELLSSLGVRHVMDSRSLAFAHEVMEKTGGEGIDVVVNSLAGEAIERGLSILRPGGRFVELGKRDILEGSKLPLRWLEDNRSFFAVDLSLLAKERPAFTGELFRDAVREHEALGLPRLPLRVFEASALPDALRHLARAEHVGKVVVRMADPEVPVAPATDPSARIHDDATYVVTGGLGGLGLVVARFLVELGARSLVLVGRSGPSGEAREAIGSMERSGARVRVESLDVSDGDAVLARFRTLGREMPPIKGIVHAAGVLDDGIVLQQTSDRFRRVMAPKVDGAAHLHRASLDLSLDFFVLFSSAAAVLGSAGQSSYAAANAFLDGLAHYRRSKGLPAISIDWGPWSEVGLAARPDRGGRLSLGGIESISPREGAEALSRILLGDTAQVAVVKVDWLEWMRLEPALAEAGFFRKLAEETGAAGRAPAILAPSGKKAEILSAEHSRRAALLEDYLRQRVSDVVRLAASKIDVDRPLLTMGIDSLMAVELKNRIERELGVTLPLLQLIKGPSLAELARTVLSHLTGETVSLPERVPIPAEEESKSLLLSLLALKEKGQS
jgi:acyl transferase domain-containing protein/aryl carrier-like protein